MINKNFEKSRKYNLDMLDNEIEEKKRWKIKLESQAYTDLNEVLYQKKEMKKNKEYFYKNLD